MRHWRKKSIDQFWYLAVLIFFPSDINFLRIEIAIDAAKKTGDVLGRIIFMQTSTGLTKIKIKIKNTLWSVSFQFINKKQL